MQNIFKNFSNVLIIFFILFILSISFIYSIELSSGDIFINEVMPHTNNSWKDEWVEIYNSGSEIINISGWKIGDKASNDTIHSLIIYPESYALIVDTNTNLNGSYGCDSFSITPESCIEFSTIGSGLNDYNESIFLYDNEINLIDLFEYVEDIKSTGKSWNRNQSNILACFPTPGFQNNCTQSQTNSTNQTTNNTNSTNSSDESFIEILDYPENTQFGKTIKIDFHVYKGNTGKYAVYAYVENEDGDKVSNTAKVHAGNSSSSSKYKDYYFENVEIELKCLDEEEDYELVVFGLDVEDRKDISIDSCNDELSASTTTESVKIEYYVNNQETAEIGKTIFTLVNIVNNENKDYYFSVWTYVFRGSKCYSCIENREENTQEVFVQAKSESEIYLENIVENAEEGEYNLKIKILKQGLKTPKEFTFPIYLENSELEYSKIQTIDVNSDNYVSGNIMNNFDEYGNYREIKSKKSEIMEMLPYAISTISLLFCVFLLLKKI